ncbi:MAG: hypothetical protein LBM04_10840 [Opitutaceae bacterium]|nr:hypothetical protein [Opitutaceae bacterium]
MKKPLRLLLSLVFLLVLLPLAFQGLLLGIDALVAVMESIGSSGRVSMIFGGMLGIIAVALFIQICFRSGRSQARRAYSKNNDNADASAPDRAERLVVLQPSASFPIRYLGVIVACGYTMLVALIAICLPPWQYRLYDRFADVFIWAHCTSMFFWGDILQAFRAPPWLYFIPPLMVYAVYAAGMVWEFCVMRTPRTRWPGRVVLLAAAVVCVAALCAVWQR